jgi:hypothetical protein
MKTCEHTKSNGAYCGKPAEQLLELPSGARRPLCVDHSRGYRKNALIRVSPDKDGASK